jgi:hypothetical protein
MAIGAVALRVLISSVAAIKHNPLESQKASR